MSDPVRMHAERVLFGVTLADKVAPWPEVDVGPAAPIGAVSAPGRPAELALPAGRRGLPPVRPGDLDRAPGRARVLHELLNHELQAAELLALALLRWPDAPPAFRRGLVATLRDEQTHLGLYLERLRACGGDVGHVPVSRFFWDTLSPVTDVTSFVAGLSLCFEAANLDFAGAWRERFARAGDPATAEVLARVYDDEIRHVAHGLTWFGRWNTGDRVAAWTAALPPPLTPAWGRGPTFDVAARRRAGFSAEEIEAIRLTGGSRGRPPRVVWFDAGVEDVIATGNRSGRAAAVTADLATLPLFLVSAEDVVVAPAPGPAFLGRLGDAGFVVPRFVDRPDAEAIGPHPVLCLDPWGPTPAPLYRGDVPERSPLPAWDDRWRALSSKAEVARRAAALAHPAVVAARGAVWTAPGDPGPGRWVIKAPFSTAGTDRIRGEGALTADQRRWVARRLDAHGEVVWQPWYDRVADVSVHLTVDDVVRIDGVTRFATTAGGVYRGTWLGRWLRGLPTEVERAAQGDGDRGRAVQGALEEAARAAGAWALSVGYRGPLSIDGVLVREGAACRVHPWLETNARRTLGRVALALARRIDHRSSGWWRVERRTPEGVARLVAAPPVVVREGRIVSGVLATTDPTRATTVLTWLDVSGPATPEGTP